MLQGVKAIIAITFERIHRSNLVGMGILPLQFTTGEDADKLGLTGKETFSIGNHCLRSSCTHHLCTHYRVLHNRPHQGASARGSDLDRARVYRQDLQGPMSPGH